MRRRGWARVIVATVTLLWALLSPAAQMLQHELRFDQAEFIISDEVTPPLSGWQPQVLPDSWIHNRPGVMGFGWYRMRFNLDAVPSHATALYVSRVASTGQFWLNGSVLNPEIRFTLPGGRVGSQMNTRPHLTVLPSGLLRTGENVLHIRVQTFGVGGDGLWDVRVGPLEHLLTPWRVRHFFQQTVARELILLMMAALFVALALWWRERTVYYVQVMSAAALWTTLLVIPQTIDLPFTREGLSIFYSLLMPAFYWALLGLYYRYSESTWHWYPRALNWVCGLTIVTAVALVIFSGDSPHLTTYFSLVLMPTALLRLLAMAMLVNAAQRTRMVGIYALAAAELLWFCGFVQLIGILGGWLPPVPFRLDAPLTLPLFLVLAYLFIRRFVRERDEAVRQQHTAILAERERILHDMHDGMGSQLVTALRLASHPEVERALIARNIEDALQDMRLIIDSLDASNQTLMQLLGNLRYRLAPRLAALNIHLDWNVEPLPELDALTSESNLDVLRIVQEAINNAVRHAQPSAIAVSITRKDDNAVIAVTDNGLGFDSATAEHASHGLSGMRRRAARLGATLLVELSNAGGSLIALHVPLAARRNPSP